jgi:predicted dehydrogenase
MSERSIRAGVAGVGALGRHHARIYAELPGVELAGVCDALADKAEEVGAQHGCPVFENLEQLVAEVDVVSVAVPTAAHHDVVRRCLVADKDVLVEKPIAATLEQAEDLAALAEQRGRILQVGHVERFNPAVDFLFASGIRPRFIEVHRLAPFTPRSLDVDVILDLMIHDLDIVVALDRSDIVQIDSVGVPVLTQKVDIANARLRFDSGLIANLTASRVSAEKMRKFRVFSSRGYVSLDMLARRARIIRLVEEEGQPRLRDETHAPSGAEPLVRQLSAFLHSVRKRTAPIIGARDGCRVLRLAKTINDQMGDSKSAALQ